MLPSTGGCVGRAGTDWVVVDALPPVTLPLSSKVIVPKVFGGVGRRRRRSAGTSRVACAVVDEVLDAVGASTASCSAAACRSASAGCVGGAGDGAVGLGAAGVGLLLQFLEAELVVFLHLAHLLLHLQDLEVEFLDGAVERADLLLERGDARIAGLRHLHGPAGSLVPPKTLGRPMLGQPARRRRDRLQASRVRRVVAPATAGAGQQQHGERAAQDRSKIHGRLAEEWVERSARNCAPLGFIRHARLRPNFVCAAAKRKKAALSAAFRMSVWPLWRQLPAPFERR